MKFKLISKNAYRCENLFCEDLRFKVPLNWQDADDPEDKATNKSPCETLSIFARILKKEANSSLPYLLFLQGGPGFESPRTTTSAPAAAWIEVALERFQVILLDQRGTGLSSPLNNSDLRLGTEKLVARLKNYRADSIVCDCEALRQLLGIDKFNLLGQSFGGFTILNYLCNFPQSLNLVFLTGGLSCLNTDCQTVYRTTYARMKEASDAYYRRFPEDKFKFAVLAESAKKGEIILPSGEKLSLSRLRSLGHLLGSDTGWFKLHSLLEFDPKSNVFLYDLQNLLPFSARNPIYLVLHESCYADGTSTDFAAKQILPEEFRQDQTLLTGEHIDPEWFETVPEFRPWKEVAYELAKVNWPHLYNEDSLRRSMARGAAAVYYNDRYVPLEFSLATARLMPNLQLLITSEYEHSGLRTSGEKIIRRLFALAEQR